MSWRPIATAPRDFPILAYFPDAVDPIMKVELLEFEGDPDGPRWWVCNAEGQSAIDVDPTHWHPLPSAPEGAA